jgi:hypothetical protein
MPDLGHTARRYGKYAWRYGVPPLVAGAVGWYFYKKLRQPELWSGELHLNWLLLPAALVYLCAYAIWGRYYVTLLRNQGATVSTATGLRAYFVSQTGKYVPGKLLVIFIRIAMLGKIGIGKIAVGITAAYESLVWAGSGAMVGLVLLPESLWEGLREGLHNQPEPKELPQLHRYWLILPLVLAPVGLVGLNRFINRVNRWRKGPEASQLPRVKLHMVAYGLGFDALGWLLLGVSFMLAVNGVLAGSLPISFDSYWDLTSIVSIAFVMGFVAFFMPGGLGVRDLALQLLLAVELRVRMGPDSVATADGLATVIAIVFRLLGTVSELVIAGVLYKFAPSDSHAGEVAHE